MQGMSLATGELDSSLQSYCTKGTQTLAVREVVGMVTVTMQGRGVRKTCHSFMNLFRPYCFDLNVPAECTEWLFSIIL